MKQKPIRSPKHLARIRKLDCMITNKEGENCNQRPVQAHHLMRMGNRGMSMKEWDCFAVPLCWKHHGEVTLTGDEPEFWALYGFAYKDVADYAAMLWRETLDGK